MAPPWKKPNKVTPDQPGTPLQDKANNSPTRTSDSPSASSPSSTKSSSKFSELTRLLPGSSTRYRGKGKPFNKDTESPQNKQQDTPSPESSKKSKWVRFKPPFSMEGQKKENVGGSYRPSAEPQQLGAGMLSGSAPVLSDRAPVGGRIATMDELEGHLRANPLKSESTTEETDESSKASLSDKNQGSNTDGGRSRVSGFGTSLAAAAMRRFSAGDAIEKAAESSSSVAKKRETYPSAMKSKGSATPTKHVSFEDLIGKKTAESNDERRSMQDSDVGNNAEQEDEHADFEDLPEPRNYPFKHRGFPASLHVHERGKTAIFNNKIAHPTSFDVTRPRSWHPVTDPAKVTQNAVQKYIDSPDAHKRIVEHYDDNYNKVVTHAGGSIETGEYDEFMHSLYGNNLHVSEFPSNMRIYRQAERQEEPKVYHTGRWHDKRLVREERQKYSPGRMSVAAEAKRFDRQTGLRRKGTHLDDHYGRKRFKAKTRCRTWICLTTFAVLVGLLAFGLYWGFKNKNKNKNKK